MSAQVKAELSRILKSPFLDEETLFAKRSDGFQGLLMALSEGHVATVRVCLEIFLGAMLSLDLKKKLLLAMDAMRNPGLFFYFGSVVPKRLKRM